MLHALAILGDKVVRLQLAEDSLETVTTALENSRQENTNLSLRIAELERDADQVKGGDDNADSPV